jgi:hypothetical protein
MAGSVRLGIAQRTPRTDGGVLRVASPRGDIATAFGYIKRLVRRPKPSRQSRAPAGYINFVRQ